MVSEEWAPEMAPDDDEAIEIDRDLALATAIWFAIGFAAPAVVSAAGRSGRSADGHSSHGELPPGVYTRGLTAKIIKNIKNEK